MNKFLPLLKVSLKSMLLSSTKVQGRNRKHAVSGLGAMALIAFLGLYLSGLYSSMLMSVLAPLHMESLLFVFMGMLALVGGLLFTTFAVKGVVFGGKDNDLLLSLPVPSSILVASRISAIYLENLLFSFFVLLPAGVVCALFSQIAVGRSLLFWVRLLIAALALPLLDTALSVLLGALVAFFSARVSKGALGQNIIMAFFLVAVFYFSFHLSGMIESLAANAAHVKASLSWAAPLLWMAEGILHDWPLLLAFVASCVAPFAFVVLALSRVYQKAVTAFASSASRNNFQLSPLSASSQKKALLMKDALLFFGSPMYLWNSGLGLIILAAASIASLFFRQQLMSFLTIFGDSFPLTPFAALFSCFCLATSHISAPSISLEGKFLWILREAPINVCSLLWLKVAFHLILALPCAFLSSLCLTLALQLPLWHAPFLLAATALFALGHAAFGLLMGLYFPMLDAPNQTMVIKQSLASMLAIFLPLALLIPAALLYSLGSSFADWLALALPVALFALFAALSSLWLSKRGPLILNAL